MQDSSLAFVFPGTGSGFVGAALGVREAYPQLDRALLDVCTGASVADALYPPNVAQHGGRPIDGDVTAVFNAEVYLQLLYATLVQVEFGLRPGAAIGMSLGSTVMAPILSGDAPAIRLALSTVGPVCDWIDWQGEGNGDLQGWTRVGVICPPDRLAAALREDPSLHLVVRGDDTTSVLTGPAGRLRSTLARHRIASAGMTTGLPLLHTPHVAPMLDRLRTELEPATRAIPRMGVRGIDFYASVQPVRAAASPAAMSQLLERVLESLAQPLDFPAMVRAAWQRGVRTFVVVGAGERPARWIGRILDGQRHASISLAPPDRCPLQAVSEAADRLRAEGFAIGAAPAVPAEACA